MAALVFTVANKRFYVTHWKLGVMVASSCKMIVTPTDSFRPLYSCDNGSLVWSFFPLFQVSLFMMQWFTFWVLFFVLDDPFSSPELHNFQGLNSLFPRFFEYEEVPYRAWLNPAVTACQVSIDLLLQGMLSAASSIHAYIDINKSYKCLSKLLSFCILVQKVFRTHEILSLIFFYYWVHFSSCY